MKRLKSLLSLVMVLVMVLSFAVPAMATTYYGASANPNFNPGQPSGGSSPSTPALTDATLQSLIKIKVTCESTPGHSSTPTLVSKDSGSTGCIVYDLGTYYQVLVTSDPYIPANPKHYLSQNSVNQHAVNIVYDNGAWKLKDSQAEYVTLEFKVTENIANLHPAHGGSVSTPTTPGAGTYTVTYAWSGSAPYGVTLPAAERVVAGKTITLSAPSKTVVADRNGYWVFNGWTVYGSNCYTDTTWRPTQGNGGNSVITSHTHHSGSCKTLGGTYCCATNCTYYGYYHLLGCSYSAATSKWSCDYKCKYYTAPYYGYTNTEFNWMQYCREEGIRWSDFWDSSNWPLSYTPSNTNSNHNYTVSATAANASIYTKYCGHRSCTGVYCDIACVCEHDECPLDRCLKWNTTYYSYCYTCGKSHYGYCDWNDYYYYNGYYYPQTITVNSNITVYGSWSFQPAGGTLVLSAYTMAASGYNPENYVFEIYSATNTTKPYKTVTVKAGSNQYVALENGTYYIYAVKKDVEGYNLETTVSGDVAADGAKIVMAGDAIMVKYSSLYSKNGVEFNTEDHVAYLNGYKDGSIKPTANITREEVASILYRLLSDETVKAYGSSSNSFTDVKDTRWSNTAISTLVNAGVMGGYENGTVFKPASNMTRAELVTALVKITGISGGRAQFTDCSNHWANNAINAAANAGWVTGYDNGEFLPDAPLTRAETVTIINRVLNRNPSTVADLIEGMKTFTDNMKTTKWYYMDIQEAANGHTYGRDTDGSEYWTGLK